jgi:hypothetical protein
MLPTLFLVLIGIVGAVIVVSLLGTLYFRIKRGPLKEENDDVEMVGKAGGHANHLARSRLRG